MATRFVSRLSEPMGHAWQRPLSLRESLYVALVLFGLGTVYCQIYCLIAFQAMHGMAMPLSLSMWRSAIETIPAFMAFELAKRVLGRSSGVPAFAGVGAVLLLAATLSIALVLVCHGLFFTSEMPVRPLIADRLPGITLTALAIAWASRAVRTANGPHGRSAPASADELPPAEWIDWVQSAGNYVELHSRGRTRLVRMTLRQATEALGPNRFVQIHRTMIVNRERIAGLDRAKRPYHVRLSDGTLLRVGDAYRGTVA